jgi:hypothetical protein
MRQLRRALVSLFLRWARALDPRSIQGPVAETDNNAEQLIELRALQAADAQRIKRLQRLLNAIQWSAATMLPPPQPHGLIPTCPQCWRLRAIGHDERCTLAAELRTEVTP